MGRINVLGRVILKFVMVLALVSLLAGLTACGGATFVRGGMDPLKSGDKVGVLVTSYQLTEFGRYARTHRLNAKLETQVASVIGDLLKDDLTRKGFAAMALPSTGKIEEIVQKYKDLPRNLRGEISSPDAADFGDLRVLFRESGISRMLLFSGATDSADKSALAPGVIVNPSTVTFTGVLDQDGKLSFFNRKLYAENGDINSFPQRAVIIENVIDTWISSSK